MLKETGTVNFVPADSFEALLKTLEAGMNKLLNEKKE